MSVKKILTLCIIYQHPRVLLGMKKRGFGAGRWNGFGGKISPDETIEEAARREIKEEVGLEVLDMCKMGIMEFEFKGNPQILEVHIFKTEKFVGEPVETEEMKPEWFHVHEIPFDKMWPDDIFWMPLLLSNKKFKGKILFGESDVILDKEIMEVEVLGL